MTDCVRGIVLEDVGDRIVICPTDREVAQFAPDAQVGVRPWSPLVAEAYAGQVLYDAHGARVAVVHEVHIISTPIDITPMQSDVRVFAEGSRSVSIIARGLHQQIRRPVNRRPY